MAGEDDRHPIVDRCHKLVGGAGDDRAGGTDVVTTPPPQAGERVERVILQMTGINCEGETLNRAEWRSPTERPVRSDR